MAFQVRDTQTQVKHRILREYLGAWSGIIRKGIENSARRYPNRTYEIHFLYVDCFAFEGIYAGDQYEVWLEKSDGTVPGSPLIGINAMDSISTSLPNLRITTNTILFENDADTYRKLRKNLEESSYGFRLKETDDFESLLPGEIALVNADSTRYGQKLIDYTSARKYMKAFFFVDPYGPSGIPYQFVEMLVRNDNSDVMINFIYSDLHRKSGALESQSLAAHTLSRHIEYWTNAFGSEKWKELIQEIDGAKHDRSELGRMLGIAKTEVENDPLLANIEVKHSVTDQQISEIKERRLVDLYQSTLAGMDAELAIKVLRLRFPDKERTMFYLFLTTHDGTGALALNDILFNASLWENELRYIREYAKRQLPKAGQLRLLPPDEPEIRQVDKGQLRPSTEKCMLDLLVKTSGKALSRRQVYKAMADDIYFANEIDKALSELRKRGRASYQGSLRNDTTIKFS